MNTFAVELWDNEGHKCSFYTVRQDDAAENETDKFFNKYDGIPEFKNTTRQLLSFILDSIGDDHGAVDQLFNRFENEVVGLPDRGKVTLGGIAFLYPEFPLRLYALRVRNRSDIVILFNGGVKSSWTNQGSKDILMKWRDACKFAERIEEALRNGEIVVDESARKILTDTGDEEILL